MNSSLRSGTRQGCSFSLLLFSNLLDVLARVIWQENKVKGTQFIKEKVKSSLFTQDEGA
jgi:hypothetical protein